MTQEASKLKTQQAANALQHSKGSKGSKGTALKPARIPAPMLAKQYAITPQQILDTKNAILATQSRLSQLVATAAKVNGVAKVGVPCAATHTSNTSVTDANAERHTEVRKRKRAIIKDLTCVLNDVVAKGSVMLESVARSSSPSAQLVKRCTQTAHARTRTGKRRLCIRLRTTHTPCATGTGG